MDEFTEEFNQVRPHEANDMKTPTEVHQLSKIEYPESIKEFEFSFEHRTLKVTKNGSVRWGPYHCIFIGRGYTIETYF